MFHADLDVNWCVIEEDFDISKNRHFESVFSLGTGFMTTRGSLEEGFPDDDQSVEYERQMDNTTLEKSRNGKSRWGTFMPVIQAHHPALRTGIVNLPFYLGLSISIDGEELNLEGNNINGYRRWLDLKTATLYRHIIWETAAGKLVQIQWRRYMNPAERFGCVQDVDLSIDMPAEVRVTSWVDNDVRTNGHDMFTEYSTGSRGDLVYSDVLTNRGTRIVTASQAFYNLPAEQNIQCSDRKAEAAADFLLDDGQMLEIRKISFTAADPYYTPEHLLSSAEGHIYRMVADDREVLHTRHIRHWENLWEKSDIRITAEDNPGYNSQLAVRTAIFHLLKAKGPENRGLLCPKGLTTEVYFGSVFWDFEVFILPFYIYTHPEIARTAPEFRCRNLDAARKLARFYGYTGAKYPWQSDCFGEETCVPWQYADHQVHISADVALGIWHYVCATGDTGFLFSQGAEVIFETARYWSERVDWIPGREGVQILGVMGPDEYKPITNNNAFTNHVARFNLQLAVRVAQEMKTAVPDAFSELAERIKLQEQELDQFEDIARRISVPLDDERHIIWQCDDFETAYAEIDIDGIWLDRTRLFGSYVSQEKRYRSKVIKQADVLAMLAMFPEDFTMEQKAESFRYYDPFTIHDSSNSMTHRQMVAADLGWAEEAYRSWLGAIDIDFGQMPRSSDGLHYANVGGMWQQVVFGFAGVSNAMDQEILTFRPCLPEQIQSIDFPLIWKGHRLRAAVTGDSVRVKNLGDSVLVFRAGEQMYEVAPGLESEVACEFRG